MKKVLLILAASLSYYSVNAQCGSVPTINFNQNVFTLCPDDSATIVATPNGTAGPFTLVWTPGLPSDDTLVYTVSPSIQTWYYLELTDTCHTIIDSVRVDIDNTEITGINTTMASNCPGLGGTLGSIEVFPSNPSITYTVQGGGVSHGPNSSGIFSNLPGGIDYLVYLETLFGCTLDSNAFVGLAANFVTGTFVLDSLRAASCYGDNDGGAYIKDISGGSTPPFDIYWSQVTSGIHFSESIAGFPGDHDSDIDNLTAGNWVVSAVDQDGCAWSTVFTIEEPDELTIDWVVNSPTCYLFNDGSVTINSIGGNGGNVYEIWDDALTTLNSGNSNIVNALDAGLYYASITDSKSCFFSDSFILTDPGEIDSDITIFDIPCVGDSTSVIVDTVYNFSGNYNSISYFWSPNPGGSSGTGADSIFNVTSGNYSMTVNDENGCSQVFDFTVNDPQQIIFTEIGSNNCNGGSNGSVFASAAGGTGSLYYTWTELNTGVYVNNSSWAGLGAGDFSIQVVDAQGCSITDTIAIGCLGIEDEQLTINFYPNPANGVLYIEDSSNENVSVKIFTMDGKALLSETFKGKITLELGLISTGTYLLNLKNNSGQFNRILIID